MNGQSTERQAQPRRGAVPCVASCRNGVGRVQVVNRASDQTVDRHSHAIKRWQCQQRALTGILAVSISGSGMDFQGHCKTRPGRTARARADLLHQTRQLSQNYKLVCRDLGTTTALSRNGLWCSGIAARRVLTVARRNYTLLYGNRAYEATHRPENRTRERNHRPENRTYGGRNHHSLGPISVHLLDKPSVWPKSKCIYREESARGPPKGFVTSQQVFLYPT